MSGNAVKMSVNMATGNSLSSEVDTATSVRRCKTPETKVTANGSGRLPEVDTTAMIKKSETETSDGDQCSSERRPRRRRRKYGRLKRIRLESLALPVDARTESESEKRFIVVDGPQVGIFRSSSSFSTTTASDTRGQSWLGQKLINRNRKSAPTRIAGTSRMTTATMRPGERCERYFKQFVAALFSTLGLLCLMVGYTVLGGYVFRRLESSNEINVKADMRQVNTA